jgi:hypothetical protein
VLDAVEFVSFHLWENCKEINVANHVLPATNLEVLLMMSPYGAQVKQGKKTCVANK